MGYIGGSFAPPLSDGVLKKYGAMVKSLPSGKLKDTLATLLDCCELWWKLPESAGTEARNHPSGRGIIVPLDNKNMIAVKDHQAIDKDWMVAATALLGDIDPAADKELRDAAHHLLWHVVELYLGREPMTKDLL